MAISESVIGIVAHSTGHRPASAHTTVEEDVVSILLRDTLTAPERALNDHGHGELVQRIRRRLHDIMRDDLVAAVERLTGRTVVAFMADSNLDPNVEVQIFMLERPLESAEPLRSREI